MQISAIRAQTKSCALNLVSFLVCMLENTCLSEACMLNASVFCALLVCPYLFESHVASVLCISCCFTSRAWLNDKGSIQEVITALCLNATVMLSYAEDPQGLILALQLRKVIYWQPAEIVKAQPWEHTQGINYIATFPPQGRGHPCCDINSAA